MPILSHFDDGVAFIVMNRPPVNNIDINMRHILLRSLEEAFANAEVKAIVLTGGSRIFSSGADIVWEGGLN